MRISAKCDYACRALLELSLHWPSEEPLQIQEIADRQKVPFRYLVQILLQLKKTGYVTSERGKQGGYLLSKSPGDISLGGVMREVGGPLLPKAGVVEKERSAFLEVWEEVESAMARILDRVTFGDICDKAKGLEDVIIYQI